ncbi:hypothetical protein JX266_004142 [Neoarthrinium moseri]|uniref:uncharacterized protein n=1 Tax=Neoarthrinium moseri TaxID=1658444 RepID=UPI001FDD426D|nr:uncharacterized protein JN550_007492 [Neoarthrinium moseri]KAI1850284.1 hypothetical protein JX266_004142 [Neoarthrinium moseri]KAI1866639.1 hypothetical protein JN550_007492 [Neoarthrinium moseri]
MATTLVNDAVPAYTIDLSQPAESRYRQVSQDFGPRMRALTGLFEEILIAFLPNALLRQLVIRAAKVSLRRVYDEEEQKELKGISESTGVELYLLVALNNFLDCFLGCTSGAALTRPSAPRHRTTDGSVSEARLMHFRTLDWGMDELRDLLVTLEFIDSKKSGKRVLARSVTYVGFVGTLTAVREGLSLSLNFRPNHVCTTRSLRWHQFLVLLGRRRSIGSTLRAHVLHRAPRSDSTNAIKPSLTDQAHRLSLVKTSPCYLILCDGVEVTIIEKDLKYGKVRTSDNYMVHTNHDVDHPITPNPSEYTGSSMLGHEEWLEESTHRKAEFEDKWKRYQQSGQVQAEANGAGNSNTAISASLDATAKVPATPVLESTLRRWVQSKTTMAECTHFACLMDPVMGQIRWIQRGPAPTLE